MKHTPRRAVRAIAILAVAAANTRALGAVDAGRALGMSDTDADAIRHDLRRAGLLGSGRDRGLFPCRPAEQITLADVVRAVCGHIGPSQPRAPQSLRELVAVRVQAAMDDGLTALTLADIVRDARCLRLGGEA